MWTWLLGRSDLWLGSVHYMRRWRFFRTRRFGVRIHHILRSDPDRDLHDHPFNFTSVILWGGYWEYTLDPYLLAHQERPPGFVLHKDGVVRRWYGRGSVLVRRAEQLHRLELPEGSTAWTLVFRGRIRRPWGFLTDKGWIDQRDYNTLDVT